MHGLPLYDERGPAFSTAVRKIPEIFCGLLPGHRWPGTALARLLVAGRQLSHLYRGPLCGRAVAGDGKGLFARGTVDEKEAAHHFLGLGKRAIGQAGLPIAHLQPHGLLGRGQ